ncbi:ATP-grasp fold amidoligase family protein [Sphingomonas solaris]|uniref:ATP-grasp fold amidoligase family protein n=1 Tax=Alterirhizorhabdus solaris TaxID=2529389 RepID=UPI0023AF86FD|nr:ATP-grasp fold amidoligase family protein [Sphingomonas solaris]
MRTSVRRQITARVSSDARRSQPGRRLGRDSPFVGEGPALPIDYKLFVFHGRVEAIQVHLDRETGHHWTVYDRQWHRLSNKPARIDRGPPAALARMIEGAETLGKDFDFVRIDFYDVGGIPRFGEMTFYPGSGLDPVDPPTLDREFGRLWRIGEPSQRLARDPSPHLRP